MRLERSDTVNIPVPLCHDPVLLPRLVDPGQMSSLALELLPFAKAVMKWGMERYQKGNPDSDPTYTAFVAHYPAHKIAHLLARDVAQSAIPIIEA